MKLTAASSSFLVLLLAAHASSVSAQAFYTKDGPVQLVDASDFDKEVVNIEKPTLAMFFAHWCGHCKNAAPEYIKAAKSLDGIVKFAAIDCDREENRAKCGQYGVTGYPTIKLFPATKRRVPRDYQGERKAQDFLNYAVEQLPISAKKLMATELKTYVEKEPERPKVILFSTKASSSPMFRSLALDFRKTHSFAYLRATDDPMHSTVFTAARAHLGLSDLKSENNLPALVLIKGGKTFTKDLVEKYDGEIKYRQVKTWLDSHDDPASAATASVKSAASKATAKVKKAAKAATSAVKEEVIPEGGTVEWRAENLDDEKRAAAAKLKARAKSASASLASASSSAASVAASASSVASEAVSAASAKASASVKPVVSKVAETVSEAASLVNEKVANAAGAVGDALAGAADKVADTASAAADSETGAKLSEGIVKAGDSVKETFEKGGEAVAGLFGATKEKVEKKVEEQTKEAEDPIDASGFDSVEDVIMAPNTDHLLDTLAEYLGEAIPGGPEAWKAQYGEQVENARQAAREAILNAPDKEAASDIALQAEKWLLEAVKFDEDKLDDDAEGEVKLSATQKKKLNKLGTKLKARIAAREKATAAAKKKEAAAKATPTASGRQHDEL
ncbi:hypothetical protein OC845_000585 [Tilletia horrida]|nr:hypothetical protein OC845_000585 [Tilletia horrida]